MKNALLLLILIVSQNAFAYSPTTGDIAPDFSIRQLNGKLIKLSQFKGKKSVYLVFWNTWCHYCMKKTPKLKAAQNELTDAIQVIAINTGREDSIAEMKEFKRSREINYPLAFDAEQKITNLYNVHGVPTEFIIDINGKIVHRDGVPEKLADYVEQWNTKTNSMTRTLQDYLQVVQIFVQPFFQPILPPQS